MTMGQSLRIVLVRPHYPGNLGSIARVMHNFGVRELVLVDPLADRFDREARRLATHGEFILDLAVVAPDLESAVADCTIVAATSANTAGLIRQTSVLSIREAMYRVRSGGDRAAIVFGPEPSGLTNDEIGLCHLLLTIPTSPEYPALNLAQAAAIAIYEWSVTQSSARSPDAATHQDLERMFEHLQRALKRIGFLFGDKSDSLMHAVRHLIARSQPTPTEVRILHGLARQLEHIARPNPDPPE